MSFTTCIPQPQFTAEVVDGFELVVEEDRLRVRPVDRVTPKSWEALARHKWALLALLAPIEYVMLKGGVALPLPALQCAWNLDERGFHFGLDLREQVTVQPHEALTNQDRRAIERWRLHLSAIVSLVCEVPQ